MRALAWWRAAPEPVDKTKADKKAKPVSRLREAEERGLDVHLPDVEPDALYLVDTLIEAGPTSQSGAGPMPLTWADLAAWSQGTGIALLPWEARLVRHLSAEWLTEYDRAKDPKAPPPWENSEEESLGRVADDMRARIAALAGM